MSVLKFNFTIVAQISLDSLENTFDVSSLYLTAWMSPALCHLCPGPYPAAFNSLEPKTLLQWRKAPAPPCLKSPGSPRRRRMVDQQTLGAWLPLSCGHLYATGLCPQSAHWPRASCPSRVVLLGMSHENRQTSELCHINGIDLPGEKTTQPQTEV